MKKQIGQRLRLLRDDAGHSQQYVADQLKISDTSYQNYEYGKRDIPGDVLKGLSTLYSVSSDSILGLAPLRLKSSPEAKQGSDFIDVPLYGSIAAGKPMEMIEVDGTHPVPSFIRNQYPDSFLLKVEGDSMNRILPNGCYALVSPCSDIDRDNQPYAVCVNGYDATIKRVRKLDNGFMLLPDSTDPTFKARIYDYGEPGTDKITVIGRVVYYVLPFDWGF